MRLRTFHAANMKEAMARVRAEMGPDAVIIYSHERKRGRGVEVRAAVETPPRAPSPSERAAPQKPKRARAQGTEVSLAAAAGAADGAPKALAKRLNGAHAHSLAVMRHGGASDVLKRALAFHRLPDSLAAALIERALKTGADDAAQALSSALEGQLKFEPLPVAPPAPVMLVGGPGVGKTVTTAKLAARARLSGHAVKVITTDTLRSGAVEQLAKLLELMGLETATADSPEALSVWLAAHSETKKPAALFIDTPGTNALSKGERDDLLGFIKAGSIEPVLVHAAGADSTDAADDAKLFAALGVRRMIVTRLDAARRLGSLLAAADAARLSIAEVSLSPYLSEPLNALTPGALARVLITQTGSTLALRRSDSRTIEEKRSQ